MSCFTYYIQQSAEDQERGGGGAEAEGGLQAGLPADRRWAERPLAVEGRRSRRLSGYMQYGLTGTV